MRRIMGWLGVVALALVMGAGTAKATDTGPACADVFNLACATAADTITGPWTLLGGSPLVFDGTTAGTNATTLTVTDPTGARTLTVPDANSVTVQPISCGGTDKVSAISSLGLPTCSADEGGTTIAWSSLTNPTAALALSMDATETTTLTMTGNTGAADMFEIIDVTGNTGTGHLLDVHSVGTSTMKPVVFTAGGTSNGVGMGATGLLSAIGTGGGGATGPACAGWGGGGGRHVGDHRRHRQHRDGASARRA